MFSIHSDVYCKFVIEIERASLQWSVHGMVGSVRDIHWAVAVADFERSRSSKMARCSCGIFLELPTKARPKISLEPVAKNGTKFLSSLAEEYP